MSNTTATGGYLAPAASPLAQTGVENLLHNVIVGVTGLAADLVRPRWQPHPPKQPDADTDWCAFGVQSRPRVGAPATAHDPSGDGQDVVLVWERLAVLVSLYGPGGQDLAGRLLTGLAIDQNRVQLRSGGVAYVGATEPLVVPENINKRWVQRVDLTLTFEAEQRRTYPVLNIVCGRVTLETDTGLAVQTVPMTGEEE